MVTTDIRMPRPHEGQMQILRHNGSAVVFAGRRYGKTQMAVYKILREATRIAGLYWWVGLSWRSASLKRAWRLLKFYARKMWAAMGEHDARKFINESRAELKLPNGAAIWMRTAERPDSLAGEAVRGVVLDEFSLMAEIVWTEYVEAALVDYAGWALFIGVPKGKNWAATLWHQAKFREGWLSCRFTSYDNPHNARGKRLERLNEIREHTADRMFRQEYLAEIIEDQGAVFRNVAEAATAPLNVKPLASERYVIGLDWARDYDYTAMVVIDVARREMVDMDHFNKIGWQLQRDRVMSMYRKWHPQLILAEANSIGSVNIEALQSDGLPVRPFMTTAQSKPKIIEALSLAIEQHTLSIQPNNLLISELQSYEMKRMASGHYTYNAPTGLHDDLVIALALAWYGTTNMATTRNAPDWMNDRF